MGNRKLRKRTISFLLAATMVLTMAGCGIGTGEQGLSTDGTGAGAAAGDKGQTSDRAGGDGFTAMGRYVEEEIDLSEQTSYPMDLCVREDGSLVIMDRYMGMIVSKDRGVTWETETPGWLTAMRQAGTYICSLCMAPDSTVAVIIKDSDEVNMLSDTWHQSLTLILPDGRQVPVEAALTEEEGYFKQVVIDADNCIYASTFRSVYEVQRDGSAQKILSLDYNPQWIWVKDHLLFMDNDWDQAETPAIFDMKAGTYIEDEVLIGFVNDNYDDRTYNATDYGTMYIMPGEDSTVYIVGKKGIHRHVIGGNMMEQIVDGNLSQLINPSYNITDMVQLEDDAFLALFANSRVIKFTYDPNIPTVPENMLTLYSLKEDDTIRQVISAYQTKHPDIFISYKIGMGDDDSVTREDAVKKLNTEIMAGEGPDLLVMDGLPFDSYVEKGMLADLTDYLVGYSVKEPLFDNMIEALKYDGKAYAAPATIAVLQVASSADGMKNLSDMSDIAEVVEELREKYPTKDILGVSGERGILKRFAGISAPKWVSADGGIDRDIIKEYLEQCKRIHDAQMDGLDEGVREYYDMRNELFEQYTGMRMDEMDWLSHTDIMQYVGGGLHMITGWTDTEYAYNEIFSLDNAKGYEDTKVASMQGQCSHVFKPKTLLGISAASGQVDAAKGFMDIFLSAEMQSLYDGLPLNQAAYDAQFTPQQEYLGANGEYGSVMQINEDGQKVSFVTYWPSDEQIAAFKSELASLNTAYIPDVMLEDAVFKQGISYMRGEQSMDQTLDAIEKAVAIYMAE